MADETPTAAPMETPEVVCCVLLVMTKEGMPIEVHAGPNIGKPVVRKPNVVETYRMLCEAKANLEAEMIATASVQKLMSAMAKMQQGLVAPPPGMRLPH